MPVSLRIEILEYRTFTIRGFCGILGTLSRRDTAGRFCNGKTRTAHRVSDQAD